MRLAKFGITILPLLLLAGPFLICWNPLDTIIPFDSQNHSYTPLIWPGICVLLAVVVILIASRDQKWPARHFALWANVAAGTLAALMTILLIGFARNPT